MTSKSSIPSSNAVLPISVVQRLEEQRQRIERGAFTSSFGVGEFLLSRASGYESLGQVMGASVFQIGKQWTNSFWRSSTQTQNNQNSLSWRSGRLTPAQLQLQKSGREMEITTHTAAYATARRTALQRLEAEATLLGASGVAGVRLSMETSRAVSGSGAPSIEFLAIGTAVRADGLRMPPKPWLSNLSGQELWQLHSIGYVPCGFVGGNCSFLQTMSLNSAALLEGNFSFADQETHNFAARHSKVRILGGKLLNFELPEYSQAVYKARELAISRLEDEARACGADGIIGLQVDLDENAHIAVPGTGDMKSITFSFLALGTAIRREKAAPEADISATLNLK